MKVITKHRSKHQYFIKSGTVLDYKTKCEECGRNCYATKGEFSEIQLHIHNNSYLGGSNRELLKED